MSVDLAKLTLADFEPRRHEDFRIATPTGEIALKLVEVRRLGQTPRPGGACCSPRCFSIWYRRVSGTCSNTEITRDSLDARLTVGENMRRSVLTLAPHDHAKPGQARVSWRGEHSEQAAPPCIDLIETRANFRRAAR